MRKIIATIFAAAFAVGCTPALAQDTNYAFRLPCELQSASPSSLVDLEWQQGTTPHIAVSPLRLGKPVAADTLTTVRMIIGTSGTVTNYAQTTNWLATNSVYYVQWPTIGTNSGTNAWWYTVYFERDGRTYWTGNGRLFIEETTSTASNGLVWQAISYGAAVDTTARAQIGALSNYVDVVASTGGGTATVTYGVASNTAYRGDWGASVSNTAAAASSTGTVAYALAATKVSTNDTRYLAALTNAAAFATAVQGAKADTALQAESDPLWAANSNAVVRTNDSRLTDARTPLAHTQAWSTIFSTPTTLAGYGISDAVAKSETNAFVTTNNALLTYGNNMVTNGSLGVWSNGNAESRMGVVESDGTNSSAYIGFENNYGFGVLSYRCEGDSGKFVLSDGIPAAISPFNGPLSLKTLKANLEAETVDAVTARVGKVDMSGYDEGVISGTVIIEGTIEVPSTGYIKISGVPMRTGIVSVAVNGTTNYPDAQGSINLGTITGTGGITNNQTGVALGGTFTGEHVGNGASLTNLTDATARASITAIGDAIHPRILATVTNGTATLWASSSAWYRVNCDTNALTNWVIDTTGVSAGDTVAMAVEIYRPNANTWAWMPGVTNSSPATNATTLNCFVLISGATNWLVNP